MSSPQGVRAGKAFVEIGGDDSKLRKALQSATARLTSFGNVMLKIGGSFAGLGASMLTPMLAAVKSFESAGSELNDMSVRTGASVEALSALKYSAEQTGATLADVETGIKKTQKALVDAAEGGTAQAEAFDKLGLNLTALQAMNPDQQFEAVAKSLAAIEDPATRTALAMELWGKSGTKLLPLAGQIDELRNKFISLGGVMTAAQAGAADALGDQFGDLNVAIMSVARNIGAALAPRILEITQTATAAAKVFGDWVKEHKETIVTFAKLGGVLALVGGAISTIGGMSLLAAKGIGALSTAFGLARGATLAMAAATALLTRANYSYAVSSAVAQGVTGIGILKVAAGIAAAAGLAYGINKIGESYSDLEGKIKDAMAEQEKANELMGKSPTTQPATGATAKAPEADDDLANYMRVHNAKVALIEDERERAIQGVFAKYYEEMERARLAGASAQTIFSMLHARELELKKVEQDFDRKAHDEKMRHQRELETAERDRLQRIAEANIDRIDQNAALELEASGKTGTELAKARLALEKQIEMRKAAAAGEDLRLVEREYKLKNDILDRQEQMRRTNEAMRAVQDAISKIDAVGKFGGMNLEMIMGRRGDDPGRKIDETNRLLRRVVDNTEIGLTFG